MYFVPSGVRQQRIALQGELDDWDWWGRSSVFGDPFHALAYFLPMFSLRYGASCDTS